MPIVNSNNQQTTLSGNWNNPTGNYTGFRIQVTDTSSTGNSKPFAIDVNGITKFAVGKDGTVYTTGTFSGSFVSGNTGQFTSVTASNYVGITTGHVNSLTEAIQDITAAELSGRSGIAIIYDDANGITYISGTAATTTSPGVIKYSNSFLTINTAGQLDVTPSTLNGNLSIMLLADVTQPNGLSANMAPVYGLSDTFETAYVVTGIYVSGITQVPVGISGQINLQGAGSVSVLARPQDNTIIITGSAGGASTTPGGGNTQIQFNSNGSFSGLPTLTWDQNWLRSPQFSATASAGDEGGEIQLNKPVTNSTIAGSVTVDVYQNRFRIFETSGSNRGAYLDMTTLGAGVATNLVSNNVPGGSNKEVQFNNSGIFSGLPIFTFDRDSQTLTVTNVYATNYLNLSASIAPNYYGVITAMAKGLISP